MSVSSLRVRIQYSAWSASITLNFTVFMPPRTKDVSPFRTKWKAEYKNQKRSVWEQEQLTGVRTELRNFMKSTYCREDEKLEEGKDDEKPKHDKHFAACWQRKDDTDALGKSHKPDTSMLVATSSKRSEQMVENTNCQMWSLYSSGSCSDHSTSWKSAQWRV